MYIEVKGVEFSNKGAELMLHSVKQALDSQFDDYELVLKPGYLLPYKQRAVLGAWQKFSFTLLGMDWTALGNLLPGTVRRLLRHFGIVVEKDIDVVLDASGFAYSDQWGRHRLEETAKHIKRIQKHGGRYVFLSQAFGPFEQSDNASLMTELSSKAELLVARDDASHAALAPLVDKSKLFNYPDFTTLFDASTAKLPVELPQRYACIIPNNKMYGKKPPEQKQAYMQFLLAAIAAVKAVGLTPVLLNHEGEKDRKFCEQMMATLDEPPLFITDIRADAVKNIIGGAVLNLSSRFHGCVSSLSQGVPTLATSWGHKYEQLFGYYECPEGLQTLDQTAEQLTSTLTTLLNERESRVANLKARAEVNKQQVREMWATVFERLS